MLTGGKNSGNSTIKKICEDVGLKSSNFWQTDIPEKFINKTFGELYDEFCENNLVILGMYRLPGARDNNTGYIYTKPKPQTKITHRDKVFVLATNAGLKNYFTDDIINGNGKEVDLEDESYNDSRDFYKDLDDKGELYEERKKYSPFNYIRERLYEIDKEIDKLSNFIDSTRESMKDNISSGIKQEIISLLQ